MKTIPEEEWKFEGKTTTKLRCFHNERCALNKPTRNHESMTNKTEQFHKKADYNIKK